MKKKKVDLPFFKNSSRFGLWLRIKVATNKTGWKPPKKSNARILCPEAHNCWVLMDNGKIECPHWDWITLPKMNNGWGYNLQPPENKEEK